MPFVLMSLSPLRVSFQNAEKLSRVISGVLPTWTGPTDHHLQSSGICNLHCLSSVQILIAENNCRIVCNCQHVHIGKSQVTHIRTISTDIKSVEISQVLDYSSKRLNQSRRKRSIRWRWRSYPPCSLVWPDKGRLLMVMKCRSHLRRQSLFLLFTAIWTFTINYKVKLNSLVPRLITDGVEVSYS